MELQVIEHVRCYLDKNGTAQLNVEDVARGLGFTQFKNGKEYVRWETVYGYLEELGYLYPLDSSQLVGNVDFIPENIFYRLAMKAKNETAEKFQAKVADEILPSIRKHGAYVTSSKLEEMLADPDTMIKTLTALKEERAARLKAESQVKDMEPKALFADSVTASSTSILVADLAKILKQNGIEIGEHRLWNWLRSNGYAIREKGRSYNMPTQYSMERGIMEVKEGTYINSHGESTITKTTLVTGKGQIYFLNKFLNKQQVI